MEEKAEAVTESIKENPEAVARDILAAIIGENEPEAELEKPVETVKEELPESNISDSPIKEEMDLEEEPQNDSVFVTPVIESNTHSTVFSANYRSTGMDCDELDALKLMFKNKLVEVCITVRTI